MGNWMKALPANTIRPNWSLVKLSTRFSTSILLLSKREGATSCARIELLISTAIIVSMPLRFSWLILVPICGRASMMMSKAKAVSIRQNFTTGRKRDTLGINWRSKSMSPKRRSIFFRRRMATKRISTNRGISANRYRYIGLSNLNTLLFSIYEFMIDYLLLLRESSFELS